MFNTTNIKNLSKVLTDTVNPLKSSVTDRRTRFQDVDKYLEMESSRNREAVSGQLANRQGDKRKIADPEMPVALVQHETGLAYFAGTFLNTHPIFPATAGRQHEDVAEMLTALSRRDERRFQWVANLLDIFDDSLRYNLCAAEVQWTTKRAVSVSTAQYSGTRGEGQANAITYEGNQIKRLDPYNLILDESVKPYEVHEKGTFAGYCERKNYIQMKYMMAELPNEFVIKQNVKEAFNSKPTDAYYYVPLIRRDLQSVDPDDWRGFWGQNPTMDLGESVGRYEVVKLYKRIIPREYGLTKLPRSGTPQLFKLIFVNSVLLFCEPLTTGHEYLPIVVGQLYNARQDKKSFVERVMPMQDMATGMVHGVMNGMRRAIGDRLLYDPTRVRKADVDSPNPVSRIPVSTNNYQNDIRTAVHQIPYSNDQTGQFQNLMSLAFTLSEQTTGLNQTAQGNFIRGNKSVMEFDTIMSNSQARMQLGALRLSERFLNPLKEILKLNYLINAQNETAENQQTGEEMQIDPVLLREVAPEFMIADGLMPSTKLANTEVMLQALQNIMIMPEMMAQYDVPGMIVSMLKQQGLVGLDQYRRSPEEAAQMRQQQAAAEAEAAGQQPQPGAQQ